MNLVATQESGWPIIGHEQAVGVLRRSIKNELLSHAYIFTGTPGVGKHTLATVFAMTLNCEAEPPEGSKWPDAPCGYCSSCSRILRGEHPDVVEINLETQAAMLAEGGGTTGPAKELRVASIREFEAA